MKIIHHPRGFSFKNLFKKYGLDPSDETTLFLLPGVSVVQEIEDCYSGEGVWGKNLLTFRELSDFVNEASPNLKKKRISRTQVLSVTRKAAELVSGDLEVFGEFSGNRDFLNAAASIISKLKQGRISVKELAGSAGTIKERSLREKLSDIGLVYEKYEELISERGFLDDTDSVRVVSKEFDGEGTDRFFPYVRKLAVFGFSDFTFCELDVIKSLSCGVSETFFFVSDFSGLDEYEDCFRGRLGEVSVTCEEDLVMISQPGESGPETEFREFYDSHEEIEDVSRTIKKLVVDKERELSDFRVLVRSAQRRGRSVACIFEKNGIAVNLRNWGTLAESAYGQIVRDILCLKSGNFHRDDLMRLLQSPLFIFYLGESEPARRCVNLVRTLSSANAKRTTISGVPGWKRVLEHITDTDGQLASVAGAVNLALDSVSSKFGRKSFAAMTSDLRKILSELRVSESSALLMERNAVTRESFDEFFSFLRELSFSREEFDFSVSGPAEYLRLLEDTMRERTIPYKTPGTPETRRVSVTDFSSARGTNPEFVFMTGLSDGSFPSFQPNDPVLKPREKAEINRALGKTVFESEGFHYEKEKHLFLCLAEAASEKAFLSCFRYDQTSKEVNRSDFLEETMDISEIRRPGSLCVPENLFSSEDILFHSLSSFSNGDGDREIPGAPVPPHLSCVLGHLRAGVSAETKRLEADGDYTEFEGVLLSPPPRPDAFSPTALEDYGTCPFMYFSKRLLGLSKPQPPEEQRASRLELGSLAHRFLGEFMETLFSRNPDRGEEADSVALYYELRRKYESGAGIFSHLPENVAAAEKKRFFEHMLWNFIYDEMWRIEKDLNMPSFFEKEVEFPIEDVKIRGKADRVDIHLSFEHGTKVEVVDYKIGGLVEKKFFDFKNLQLPLYLRALLDEGMYPARGSYRSISNPEKVVASRNIPDISFREAVSLAGYYISCVEGGLFPPYVGKKPVERGEYLLQMLKGQPCSYCDYSDLCRVKNGTKRKVAPSAEEDDAENI